jgi:glucan biosynthesis protein
MRRVARAGCLLFAAIASAQDDGRVGAGGVPPFSHQTVLDMAAERAQRPFEALPQAPQALQQLDYSTYRGINFRRDAAIWSQGATKFSLQLFAPGFLYRDLIDIDIVENGRSRPLRIGENAFDVPDGQLAQVLADVGSYAGFRVHYPINRDDYADEFLVFQGASFFRGVSRGQAYGLSARGLAIDVAEATGEEFPVFRRFWVVRPSSRDQAIDVHALLDSPRVAGAYRFHISPGAPTRADVRATLFARENLAHIGLGPLTSMFLHGGPANPGDATDYRPAVHDSGGLAIERGNGERVWRPLINPRSLQVSAFGDASPRGFGLIQRSRRFDDYQDLEARYERRPSSWVEPLGAWGPGELRLVEIPSDSETNDNIVAYWRPEGGLRAGVPFDYRYRISWPDGVPQHGGNALATVSRSTDGRQLFSKHREVSIDWAGTQHGADLAVEASISAGRIIETRLQANPFIDGTRVFIAFDPGEADVAEFRVVLSRDGEAVGETWLYRWLRRR